LLDESCLLFDEQAHVLDALIFAINLFIIEEVVEELVGHILKRALLL